MCLRSYFSISCGWLEECSTPEINQRKALRPSPKALRGESGLLRREPMTLRIERWVQKRFTIFSLSGQLEAEHTAELERVFGPQTDYSNIVVDLKEIRLADRAAVRFLARCEVQGLKFENCPAYIREWMHRETPQ